MIKQFRVTLNHDKGIAKVMVYGHSSEESVKQFILKTERCPERSILSIEDLSTVNRPQSFKTI